MCEYSSDDLTQVLSKTLAYFTIMFVSLAGNILIICVVFTKRRMRTVTNYLIVNMALSDLLITAFNMPPTIITQDFYWFGGIHGEILCKLLPFIQALSVASSVLTLTAIAIDRFFAIVFPTKRYISFRVGYGMIAATWIAGGIVNAPLFYAQKVVLREENEFVCRESWSPLPERAAKDFTITLFLAFYVIPLVVMSVLYSFLIHKLWHRKIPGNPSIHNTQQADKIKKKVLKMLVTVVIIFALCWLPIYISQFIIFFAFESFPCGPPAWFLFLGYFLGHANSAINPCIYVTFNENFRCGVKDLLLCRCRTRMVANMEGEMVERRTRPAE